MDFEKATHEAARMVLPTFHLKGCLFHLKQCWWRKIQELGLAKDYKSSESETGNFLKHLFGIPHLNFMDVYESFVFDFVFKSPLDSRLDHFLDYLTSTYMLSSSKFPPCVWAEDTFDVKRTTNGCESLHKQLNSMFYCAHPPIFELIDRLEEVIFMNKFKMNSPSGAKSQLKARDMKKQKWMEILKEKYNKGEISRKQYVKQISHASLPLTTF